MKTFLFFMILSPNVFAMDLQEFLNTVESRNKNIQSYKLSQEAAEEKRISGDLDLTPALTLGVSYLNDKSPIGRGASIGALGGFTSTQYTLGLAKNFSTGTSVSLGGEISELELGGLPPGSVIPNNLGFGSLNIGVSQSLWKNAFGRGTQLRRERESLVSVIEKTSQDLQRRAFLTQAESAFWDSLYLEEELKLRRASLARAQRIESWINRRVRDGIADRADLLAAQSLVAARELQLLVTADERVAQQKKIRDLLELTPEETFPNLKGNINSQRALSNLIGGKGAVISLEAFIAQKSAEAKMAGSREAEDALRSDLVLSGSYKTNSLAEDFDSALSGWTETDLPTQSVNLKWVYLFDDSSKKAAVSNTKKEALAAQLMAERKSLESQTQWSELNRRYLELIKKIEAASKISQIQTQRAQAEADKFNKGRSVTSNVINSEEDAAEAELNLTKLKIEQRKLESQSRLFISAE